MNKEHTDRRGNVMYQIIIQIILIGLILGLFLISASAKLNSRDVKLQVIEKQTAMLIDSASAGTTIIVPMITRYGSIGSLEIKNGRIFASIDDYKSISGYPFFSRYSVSVQAGQNNFFIKVEK